ncbi:uncharacterized protein TNCV_2704651 [Trichonephila clavipes]|nr:uncharacterized protein TNCV_2704651 [Trichonephila clavipes]
MACDAEDSGFQMLNDDEIVTSVQEESDPVDDEADEDEDNNNNNERSKGPSNADAFSALETAMEWYEQQSVCCLTQLLLLKRIRDLAAKNKGLFFPIKEVVHLKYDPILYWQEQKLYHHVHSIVMMYMSIVGSSVPCEGALFRLLATSQGMSGNHLDPSRLERLLFLKA